MQVLVSSSDVSHRPIFLQHRHGNVQGIKKKNMKLWKPEYSRQYHFTAKTHVSVSCRGGSSKVHL